VKNRSEVISILLGSKDDLEVFVAALKDECVSDIEIKAERVGDMYAKSMTVKKGTIVVGEHLAVATKWFMTGKALVRNIDSGETWSTLNGSWIIMGNSKPGRKVGLFLSDSMFTCVCNVKGVDIGDEEAYLRGKLCRV